MVNWSLKCKHICITITSLVCLVLGQSRDLVTVDSINSMFPPTNTKMLVQQVPQVARCSHSMKEALTLSPRVATLSAGSARKCCLPRLVSATTSSSSSSKGSRREDMVRHSSHVRRPPSSHTHCHVLSQVTGERKHQCPCSLLVRCEAGRPLCCRAEQVPLFAESARLAPARCSCTTP